MRHNKVEVPLHFVWTTYQRVPLVTTEIECPLYLCIESEARRWKCDVLALNGLPDHVHLVVMFPTTITIGNLMKQVKGVSSAFGSDLLGPEGFFRWHEGYGVFALSRSHRKKVIAYVENQKRHHGEGGVWEDWEEPDITEPPLSPSA